MVYDALWELAEQSAELTALVRPKNRIKLNHTGQSSPFKEQILAADLPELVLVSTGTSANMQDTSSTSRITRQYEWLLATGDSSVVNRLLPVEWALFCAMCDWPAVLNPMTWNGRKFVTRTQFVSVNSGLTDGERNRNLFGWSSVWALEVEMHFCTSELVAVGTTTTTTTTV